MKNNIKNHFEYTSDTQKVNFQVILSIAYISKFY